MFMFDEERKACVVYIGSQSSADTYNKGFARESW
jgi:hypothetical protein